MITSKKALKRSFARLVGASALTMALALPSLASAAVPNFITHQGRLYDAAGLAINDTLAVTYTIYNDGGMPVWTETHDVTFADGYYATELGTLTPIDVSALAAAGPLELGIQIANDPELSPRSAIHSVAYALVANDAVGDINPTSVTVGGTQVINSAGEWVGNPTGLVGATGPAGAVGPTGADGVAGAAGAVGPTGPAGAAGAVGPTGPARAAGASGVVTTLYAEGGGNLPSFNATYLFLAAPVQVTIAAGQSVTVTSTKALGSTLVATNLRLTVCSQAGAGAPIIDPTGSSTFGDGLDTLRVPANTLIPFTAGAIFKGLAAGTNNFGLCGRLTVPSTWNLGDWSRTSVQVTTP